MNDSYTTAEAAAYPSQPQVIAETHASAGGLTLTPAAIAATLPSPYLERKMNATKTAKSPGWFRLNFETACEHALTQKLLGHSVGECRNTATVGWMENGRIGRCYCDEHAPKGALDEAARQ